MISISHKDGVAILEMNGGENRLNGNFVEAFSAALDDVTASDATALVSIGSDRFYSTGLDLEWLLGEGRSGAEDFVFHVQAIYARLLEFPIPTVAALNGHAFAGGAMLALAHDARLMRSDRGYFCLPEIDLATGRPLTPGMIELIRSRLAPQVCHEAILTGRRYGGTEAAERGIVEAVLGASDLRAAAVQRARDLGGHDRDTVRSLKMQLTGRVSEALLSRAHGDASPAPTA